MLGMRSVGFTGSFRTPVSKAEYSAWGRHLQMKAYYNIHALK